MRGFRVGYILTVSFLLLLAVVTLTLGYNPAPAGPTPPVYPTSTGFTYSTNSTTPTPYDIALKKYESDNTKYQQDQKSFVKDKIVPYAERIFSLWLIALIVIEFLGILAMSMGSALVGGSLTFAGVWAVLFGPIGALLWFVNGLVASFGNRSSQTFSADPILRTVGIVSIIGVIILTAASLLLPKKDILK